VKHPLTRIAGLSAAFLTSNLARGAIAFGLSLAVGRGLGVERFGRWILCTTWASTVTIVVDLGFGVLLTRDGAREDAPHGRLVSSALAARLALVIPLAAALMAAVPVLAHDPESFAGLRLSALVGIAGAVYGCFGAMFRSQPRWVPRILAVEAAWAALQLGAAWLIVRAGAGIPALLILMTAVQLAQIATAAVLWSAAFSDASIVWPTPAEILTLVRRALPFAAAGLVANLQMRIGPLLLGYLSTEVDLGAFAAAARFGTFARLAPGAVFAGALPVLSREFSSDSRSGSRTQAAFDRALMLFAVAAAVPMIFIAAPLVRIVYGASFGAAAPVLMWIGVSLVPGLTNSARKIALYAINAESTPVAWSAVALAVQGVATAALVPAAGAVGAAAAVALAEAVIWVPLWRAARPRDKSSRSAGPSSPHHESSPTPGRWPQSASASPDRG
jgi:O-antigen/teichoic acid export membrane protein